MFRNLLIDFVDLSNRHRKQINWVENASGISEIHRAEKRNLARLLNYINNLVKYVCTECAVKVQTIGSGGEVGFSRVLYDILFLAYSLDNLRFRPVSIFFSLL